MEKFKSITVILVLTMTSLVSFAQDPEPKSQLDESILEAVFRYQMVKCHSSSVPVTFFLSNQGKDPSDSFMKRFKNDESPVKKRSELGNDVTPTNEFMDKESGKFGVLLSVDKFKMTGEADAEVEGSCGFASWAAKGYKYRVILEEKVSKVKTSELTWVW
jgi:hypothetical protein